MFRFGRDRGISSTQEYNLSSAFSLIGPTDSIENNSGRFAGDISVLNILMPNKYSYLSTGLRSSEYHINIRLKKFLFIQWNSL